MIKIIISNYNNFKMLSFKFPYKSNASNDAMLCKSTLYFIRKKHSYIVGYILNECIHPIHEQNYKIR